MKPSHDFGGRQDCGRRPYQEDTFQIKAIAAPNGEPGGLLMVLADGMGGHRGGAHASAVAVQAFVQAYAAAASEPEASRLERGLMAANQRIARDAGADAALRGMGCTLLGVSVTSAGVHLVSVGDSLLYLFRNGELKRLNADHSMAPVLQQAVLLGDLTDEEVACHPNRHALRSAVMGRELTLVDLRREPLEFLPGDKLLGASDGILTLPESRIVQLLEEHNGRTAEELSSILVEAVAQAGNPHQDNVTVMLAAAPPADAAPAGKSRFMPDWLLPDRNVAEAALRRLLQPRVLAGLGAVFLIAAVAFGLFTGRSSEQEASGNPAPAADAPPPAPKASEAPAQREDAIEAKAQQVRDGDKTKEEAPAAKEAPAEGEAQPR
ncbi:MAG TPA: protein phosphatase 2C domain-containing protein [Skermanella sp.]|jgi:PPM family protein phosphatase|nr:protein phosphatase 2C domain-containing protein [Skermanella sp.]